MNHVVTISDEEYSSGAVQKGSVDARFPAD
jgi:hypothetical protein